MKLKYFLREKISQYVIEYCPHSSHFPLDADLAELENRELLDKVKRWEDSELSTQNMENKELIVQKKLAPLNEGGPMQLLKAQVRYFSRQISSVRNIHLFFINFLNQIEQLNEENIKLRQRQKELETKALDAINEKKIFQEKLKNVPQDIPKPALEENSEKIDAKEVEELSEAFKVVMSSVKPKIRISVFGFSSTLKNEQKLKENIVQLMLNPLVNESKSWSC